MKNQIMKMAQGVAKKNVFLRKIMRWVLLSYRKTVFMSNARGTKIDNKTVVFNAFNGKSYTCTPKAVYEYMLKNDKYKEYNFIWVAKNPEEFEFLKSNPNTTVVKDRSKEYDVALAKAKYWICNYRIYDYISPKKEQVYVQCWHGTPLKRLGYDLENASSNAMNSFEEICYKYRTDAERFKYILSPSAFASEKFASAWNLKKTNQMDKIVEVGYPRNDFLINHTVDDIARVKENLGIPAEKKILLYAPTWRDNQYAAGLGYTYSNTVDFDKMKEKLGDDWIVLFRAHYLVANSFDFKKYEGFVYDASSYGDINELYVIADVLMTDYSSVFFDYANLKKPVIFYMYDLQLYANDLRGFYISLDELPGPIVETEEDMLEKLVTVDQWFRYDERYEAFNNKFNYLDDGCASERLVEKIIEN